jgi:hypothetical protein
VRKKGGGIESNREKVRKKGGAERAIGRKCKKGRNGESNREKVRLSERKMRDRNREKVRKSEGGESNREKVRLRGRKRREE